MQISKKNGNGVTMLKVFGEMTIDNIYSFKETINQLVYMQIRMVFYIRCRKQEI